MDCSNKSEILRAIVEHLRINKIPFDTVNHISFNNSSIGVKCVIHLNENPLIYIQFSFDIPKGYMLEYQ